MTTADHVENSFSTLRRFQFIPDCRPAPNGHGDTQPETRSIRGASVSTSPVFSYAEIIGREFLDQRRRHSP